MDNAVRGNLLPLMPALLAEPEPMPLYAQKLLTHLLDASPAWASELQRRVLTVACSCGNLQLFLVLLMLASIRTAAFMTPLISFMAPQLYDAWGC